MFMELTPSNPPSGGLRLWHFFAATATIAVLLSGIQTNAQPAGAKNSLIRDLGPQQPPPSVLPDFHADRPSYTNPILWSDFPDCDIIRVGDTYYFWGSSAQYVPGATILSSKDLVNWEYCANVATRIENPAFDQIDESRYDRGVWAGTLRYQNGIWYNGWNEPDLGFFMYTAKDPHGPWTAKYFGGRQLYDPGLFFDDDGKVYVAHGQGAISITELAVDAFNTFLLTEWR
jgi:beta-xylosidase